MSQALSHAAYAKFCAFLKAKTGITLGDAKEYLVKSRLTHLVKESGIEGLDALINVVVGQTNRQLTEHALEAMTTNETLWFRDAYPFEILKNKLLPALSQTQNSLKIWSAACSSGQEPYSIAMLVHQFKRSHPSAFSSGISIVGTDLSQEMIKYCQRATYDEIALNRGLPDALKTQYFTPNGEGRQSLKNEITSMVTFKQLNLTTDVKRMGRFDIVFCRNVLIYFDAAQKTSILQNISACLENNGSLMLGASESLAGASDLFKMNTVPEGLYYSKL